VLGSRLGDIMVSALIRIASKKLRKKSAMAKERRTNKKRSLKHYYTKLYSLYGA
jgi:hypothetical protein